MLSEKNKLIRVTRIPAITTPAAIEQNALNPFIPNMWAANAPEYAPVNGRGTATKSVKPKNPYLSTYGLAFLCVLSIDFFKGVFSII